MPTPLERPEFHQGDTINWKDTNGSGHPSKRLGHGPFTVYSVQPFRIKLTDGSISDPLSPRYFVHQK
jgi:hypothetical protein